jgi:sugar phosphate isomerase/epimerase
MSFYKYATILSNVGSCCDRYVAKGYRKPYSLEELFDRVKKVEGLQGLELVSTWHITPQTQREVKELMQKTGLSLVSIIPDHFGEEKWGKGAFSSKDSGIRREAIDLTKALMDVAANLGGDLISLWPGQDGYDYIFTADYIKERTWFEEGVAECCAYRNDMRIAVEYKIKEPRVRSYPATVASTLLMVEAIGAENCGVTIDYGHAVVAYENVAESVAILKKHGDKLFHIHMNDNFGLWDDDMIAGSVHTIPYVEFLYWLKRTGYKGFISMDQYPYREDGIRAVEESIGWLEAIAAVVERIPESEIEELFTTGDATSANKMLRKYMFGV